MTGRPVDWSPLDREQDPVPGDAGALEFEAKHYQEVATTISDQVARLRRIAESDEVLKGEYAQALRESCDNLAGDLERTHGRFATVGEELGRLPGPLEAALTQTKIALDDAIAAEDQMRSAAAAGYTPGTSTDSADGSEDPALVVAKRRHDDARGDLELAKARCGSAVAAWDEVAAPAAARIREAADDDLKDGWFDGFKAWVQANAGWLKELSTWLGRLVLVLAVVILLVSNPAGWLMALALISSLALLAVDAALASAGEGSWADVAFDVIGVLTLGGGAVLGKAARFGRSVTLTTGGVQHGTRSGLQTLRNAFNNPGVRGAVTNVANVFRPSSYANAVRDGVAVFRAVRATPVITSPVRAGSFLFGRSTITMLDDVAGLRSMLGPGAISGVQNAAVNGVRNLAGVATVTTAIDNVTDEGIPGFDQLDDLLDDWTTFELGRL
ncbi:MAG: hypothetical protein ACRCYQ_11290 [Nocardioides sp.]